MRSLLAYVYQSRTQSLLKLKAFAEIAVPRLRHRASDY